MTKPLNRTSSNFNLTRAMPPPQGTMIFSQNRENENIIKISNNKSIRCNTSSMKRWRLLETFFNPKGIRSHSNLPLSDIKPIYCTSSTCMGICKKAEAISTVEEYLAPDNFLSKAAIIRMG
jgi:hypothetical protein